LTDEYDAGNIGAVARRTAKSAQGREQAQAIPPAVAVGDAEPSWPHGGFAVAEVDQAQAAAPESPAPAVESARFALSTTERRGLIAAADFVLGGAACAAAFVLHPGHLHSLPLFELLAFGAIWVVSLIVAGGYGFQIPTSRIQSGIAVIRALPIALLLAVLTFFLRPYVLNRTIVLLALGIGAGLLILMRITAARLLLHESLAVRAVLLSDTEPKSEILSTLRAARFECQVVATVVSRNDRTGDRAKLLDQVRELLERHKAHELIVTNNELRLVPGLAEECLTRGVRVVSGSDMVERYMGLVPVDSVDVHWYLGLPTSDLLVRPYAVVRRLTDLSLSVLISLPFLILLPCLALAIKLESPGPVFLFQRRVGEHGRDFNLVKLRTMRDDAETDGPRLAVRADPRITRVGRFLRATRLDELPQMLNILRGEMSFIGPRPERPEFVSVFEGQIPHFRSRLLVKPGLTGWAQVKAGYAGTVPEITRKLEYDLYYIKNRSALLDLQILAMTFLAVAGGKGR
jgi:exopolysaccharide biosynthesis polyprenyl glycosylphosphotransferase